MNILRVALFTCDLYALPTPAQQPRCIHVIVALCDNVHQGIVPVPKALGNGQDKDKNLYWGAAYGMRTWFDKSSEWERMHEVPQPPPPILQRALWKHRSTGTFLLADAYDGAFIQRATTDLLNYLAGHDGNTMAASGNVIRIGGRADLIAYVGHDGLMDFAAPTVTAPLDGRARQAIILCCISERYFSRPLKQTGADPLLWTTGLMAPEAYTLEAALNGWVRDETAAQVRERAAVAYNTWQKCGMAGARRLLVTGW